MKDQVPGGRIRLDNGPEFVAIAVRQWIGGIGAKTAFIEPGSPWETVCGTVQRQAAGELLNAEVFNTLAEARVLIELGKGETVPPPSM